MINEFAANLLRKLHIKFPLNLRSFIEDIITNIFVSFLWMQYTSSMYEINMHTMKYKFVDDEYFPENPSALVKLRQNQQQQYRPKTITE